MKAVRICFFLFVALLWDSSLFSQSFRKEPAGGVVESQNRITVVKFYTPSIVRIIKYNKGDSLQLNNNTVVVQPAKVVIGYVADKASFVLFSDSLRIVISRYDGSIHFYANGRLLTTDSIEARTVFISLADKKNSYRIRQNFLLDSNEAIYGLGQHQTGSLNQRNQTVILQQTNTEIAMPVLQSSKGYGIFWNNTSATLFKDTLRTVSFLSDKGMSVDYFMMNGGSVDQVVGRLRYLTGAAPMLPKWSFGFWQSRERYTSQRELLGVVKKYRELKVPLDGIVQDWRYWGMDFKDWNSIEFGNPSFAAPQVMVDSAHKMHAHMIISVWPSFGINTEIYKELKDKHLLLDSIKTWPFEGDVKVYNAFSPIARDIYWNYMNRNIFSLGMDGWWLDATEPIDKSTMNYRDLLLHTIDTIPCVANDFPLVTTGGVYAHQRLVTNKKRVLLLTRSAYVGQQRNATIVWSGDIHANWKVMHDQVACGLNIGMSGIPCWNTDLGGFFSIYDYPKGLKDSAYHELYVRWLQMGTFFPMMRSHGTNTYREIYQFGKKGDWNYDAIEKYIRLRYNLLPYIYSTAWDVTCNAGSFMRPMFADFPKDTVTYDLNDQYLFGKSILVAPVMESQYIRDSNAIHYIDFSIVGKKKVYLPSGCDWFDFWTGQKSVGGQFVMKETPIDVLPLYVKAGSILPVGKDKQYVSALQDSSLVFNIYPGRNGAFTLYEDEGDNYNYEKGKYSTIQLNWDDAKHMLTIHNRKGMFEGMLHRRKFIFRLIKEGTGFLNNAKAIPVIYNGKKLVAYLP